MGDIEIIDLNPDNIADYGVCGYKDLKKHVELRRKIDWFKEYYPKGLRIKVVMSKKGGYQGMLEYIPGEYAHRPVDVDGYMFIQCIFVGFRKEFKGKGLASMLLDECIKEAEDQEMLGVAVVTRKGPFMVGNDIFLHKGFEIVDSAEPDFHLMVKKFDDKSENPKFRTNMKKSLTEYSEGLTILRSVQCPYTEKNVNAIIESAKNKFKLKTNLIDLKDAKAVQNTPCAFGSFCLIYNGEILSYHPISKGRFVNIMKKKIK
ncbi:GNAT family N-acetyltransferase [Methanobacterium ferruginis]|uniref:GNAT family N-acetyltransferase n=1 Tax=Methanobacterium ferruginis TaxID=710191 RepID=UPI002573872A|nr:GNAT family N-acetyltransferase [Methanobacterium ferruginis]BDZ69230.1 acetyltransferase [Methanobacterium ferruginis]